MPDIPRYEIAERALESVRGEIEQWREGVKPQTNLLIEIAHIVDLANARLRMMSLRRRRPGANWLAKVSSFTYPRQFAEKWGADPDPHLCFQIEVTDGPKAARDRYIEIQVTNEDAERLARQILDMLDACKRRAAREGS